MADGIHKLTVNMTYFWNMFLPILIFVVFGAILLMIMKWPDDTLEVISRNVKNIGPGDPK